MGCTRVSQLDRLRVTRGPGGAIVAAREVRHSRSDKGLQRVLEKPCLEAKSITPRRTAPALAPGAIRPGQTAAKRSERSRRTQLNSLLDHFPGYVLAYLLGGFRLVTLRTPAGTTVEEGHQALVHLRTGLAKRFPYVSGLVLQPDLFDDSLQYVRGSAWFADYSLEASDNGSPHYHLMVAIFGYDPAMFESAICELWKHELKTFLNRSVTLGPYYIHVGQHLGPETVQYMVGHKRSRRGKNAQDFTEWLAEGESLGTDWHGAMGKRCRALVRGHGEFLEHESVEALRARAVVLDEVRWNGREVPAEFAHFQDQATGRQFYVVSGPWLGSAARYLATGSLRELAAYRRALLEYRHRKRERRLRSSGGGSYHPDRGFVSESNTQ